MIFTAGAEAAGRDDPLYQECMAHLQTGEWEEALSCFQTLAERYPESTLVQEALDEARFKAELDATVHIKARRWVFPRWRLLALRILAVLVLVLLIVGGVRLINQYVAPALAEARDEHQRAQLLAEAHDYLKDGNLDVAIARYEEVLDEVPDQQEAQQGLAQAQEQRELLEHYQQAVALQEAEEYDAALAIFNDIVAKWPDYRDVGQRIAALERKGELEQLFTRAEADYRAGRAAEAISRYEQIRDLSTTYQQDVITERLFTLYLQQGRALIAQEPPAAEVVPAALDYFTQAVALHPHEANALQEQSLAQLFLAGQTSYYGEQWDEAVAQLRLVYDQRTDYLGSLLVNLLYDAYVYSGDQHAEKGDIYFAYEQYRKAMELPVEDTAWAHGRLFRLTPLLTPTPTPVPTPALRQGAGTLVLSTYHGQIVFFSREGGGPGELWVMDPTGENRRYLGRSDSLRRQYDLLVDKARRSPDGSRYVFAKNAPGTQLFIALSSGAAEPQQLTTLNDICYDPVWSPDGSHIAFVSRALDSDDIWVINADGNEERALTPNPWEWDKHPFWSPDSRQLVFWSNRTGFMQIYVMDADGRNVQNISNTEWDEYDPIWIK